MSFRNITKRFLKPFFKFWYDKKGSKKRTITYKKIELKLFPKVFSPLFTLSTKILLKFIDGLDIKNKKFLELGAGSGIISFFASSEGAYVTASEIAEPALDGLYYNNKKLDANITIIESNLFDKLDQVYDIIIINPPYYPKEPKNDEEIAWFCGSNFEYFNKLFSSIHQVVDSNTQTYMILSEDCNLDAIKSIADKNGYVFKLVFQKIKWFEKNFIFKIENK